MKTAFEDGWWNGVLAHHGAVPQQVITECIGAPDNIRCNPKWFKPEQLERVEKDLKRIPRLFAGRPLRILEISPGVMAHSAACRWIGHEVQCTEAAHNRYDLIQQQMGFEVRPYTIQDDPSIPYADAEFDLVICLWTLIFEDPEIRKLIPHVMREMARVLKPGGQIYAGWWKDNGVQDWRPEYEPRDCTTEVVYRSRKPPVHTYLLLTKREPTNPDMEIVERRCCPVCGAVGGHVYAVAEHSRVLDGKATWLECPDCKLVYQPWFYRLPELTDLFKRTPAPYRTDSKIDGYDLHFDEKCPGHRNRLKRFTSRCASGSLVVELGFGGGILLNLLTDSGRWDGVVGIEIVHRYVEHAKNCGFEAHWADISSLCPDCLRGKAELVIASEVLEHVEEPVRFLAGARTLLAPGGIVAVSFAVPDKREKLSASEWQYWRQPSIVKAIELAGYSAESSEIQVGSTLAYAWLHPEADCG